MTANTDAIPLVLISILSYDLLIALLITWLERLMKFVRHVGREVVGPWSLH